MLRALLDVTVLIALLDAAHIGHAQAHQWLAANGQAGWASCPITPDDVSLLAPGTIDWQHVLAHRQVTDDHLLALAVRHQGCFVSFDARVRLAAVAGAQPSHLVLLAG